MSERLPGAASEIIKGLFARVEAFDLDGLISFYTDTPYYQFSNSEPCYTKDSIKQAAAGAWSQISAIYHEIKMMWEVGDVVFVEQDVIFWGKDGSIISLPGCDIFRLEGDKIAEQRIYMDAGPLYNPALASSRPTSSVLITSQGKKLTPPGIMRKYFNENPEGKKRMAEGFAPKWSLVKSQPSLVEA
jgi:hypothetical protein